MQEETAKWKRRTRQIEDERDDYAAVAAQKDYKLKEMELMNLQLKEKLESVMEKALWPSQTEILKSLPRQQTQGDENEYAQNQGIQIAYLLPEEIVQHDERNKPQTDKEEQLQNEI